MTREILTVMGRGNLVVMLACAASTAPALANPSTSATKGEPPKRLLDAPQVQVVPRAFPSWARTGATVRVTWQPVAGAVRYHAMWTGPDGKPADTWSQSTAFHREKLPPGHYTLQIAAMDAQGLEGALTAQLPIDVVEVSATPPGKDAAEAPTRGSYAVGTRFASEGLACTLGGRSSSERVKGAPEEVRAATAGLVELRCGDKLVAPIVIAPVIVASKEAPLPRGQTTSVHVNVASAGAIGDHLKVDAIGDAKLAGAVERTAFGITVPLEVAADAQAAAIAVGGDGLELGRVGFELVDPPQPPPPPPVPGTAWAAFDLSVVAGGFIPTATGTNTSAPTIGHPTSYLDNVTAGPLFGPRLGFYPTPRLGIEAQAEMMTLPTERGNRVATFGTRGQLALRVFDSGPMGVRLFAGAGVVRTLQDSLSSQPSTSGEVHYGFAFAVEATDSVGIRLDAADIVTTARDAGYAHNLELELALVARLGRHDRW